MCALVRVWCKWWRAKVAPGSGPGFDTMIQITRQQETFSFYFPGPLITFSYFPLNSWTTHHSSQCDISIDRAWGPSAADCWYKDKSPPLRLSPLWLLTSCPRPMVCLLVFELVISGIFNELVKINPPKPFVICILLLRILSKLQSLIDDKLMSGWFLTDDRISGHM